MTVTITAFERSPDGGKGLARDTRVPRPKPLRLCRPRRRAPPTSGLSLLTRRSTPAARGSVHVDGDRNAVPGVSAVVEVVSIPRVIDVDIIVVVPVV